MHNLTTMELVEAKVHWPAAVLLQLATLWALELIQFMSSGRKFLELSLPLQEIKLLDLTQEQLLSTLPILVGLELATKK